LMKEMFIAPFFHLVKSAKKTSSIRGAPATPLIECGGKIIKLGAVKCRLGES
jgi:hypothetical protein